MHPIYDSNIEEPKYVKQVLTDVKREIDGNTIIVGNFNTPLTSMDRSSTQKINKETLALNNTLDQMNFIFTHIHRMFHPNAEEYTFFSNAQ